jgi:hypothetical protein
MQHFLYFFPLPQGQGALRLILLMVALPVDFCGKVAAPAPFRPFHRFSHSMKRHVFDRPGHGGIATRKIPHKLQKPVAKCKNFIFCSQ